MKHTKRISMYVVDYESGSSLIHEFMNKEDLKALLNREKSGSVKIRKLVNLQA